MPLLQMLGLLIPYVEFGKQRDARDGQGYSGGTVDCNVIMMGKGGGGKGLGRMVAGEEELGRMKRGKEGGEERQRTWIKTQREAAQEGEEEDVLVEEEMAALRSALKASRVGKTGDDDDSNDDGGKGSVVKDLKAHDALKGVGVEELARQINALHHKEEEQQHACAGRTVISYLNTVRFNRYQAPSVNTLCQIICCKPLHPSLLPSLPPSRSSPGPGHPRLLQRFKCPPLSSLNLSIFSFTSSYPRPPFPAPSSILPPLDNAEAFGCAGLGNAGDYLHNVHNDGRCFRM